MFCTQCGAHNPDGANHCGACGAPMGTPAKKKAGFDPAASWKSFRGSKFFLPGLIGAAALILVAVVVLAIALGGGESEKSKEQTRDSLLNNYFESIAETDVDLYLSSFPNEVFDANYMDEDDIEYALEDMLFDLEWDYGENIKITCKIVDEEKWDKYDTEDFAEYLENYYDMDADKITEIWTVECDVTIKGSEDKETDEMEFTVIKYKGKWYLAPDSMY